jgi:hypothetical protein
MKFAGTAFGRPPQLAQTTCGFFLRPHPATPGIFFPLRFHLTFSNRIVHWSVAVRAAWV